jgi:hypothetical protein
MGRADLATLEEIHTAGRRDPLGHPRCEACGFIWPCPDLRDALPAQTADELEVVALVDVGWSVWKARPGGPGAWSDVDDAGGTVVGWWDDPGPDTPRRIFRCLDSPKGRHAFVQIPAGEIDVAACALPNASTLRSHARRLAREFSQRKGVVSQHDLSLLETAVTLLRVIA